MSPLRSNILANYAGHFITVFVSLLVVPFYFSYLGKEAYGVVSFFLSLQAVVGILDMGLSTGANRELARFSAAGRSERGMDLLRTLEVFYVIAAALIFLLLALASSAIASIWVHADGLTTDYVSSCLVVFAATLALRWPIALYTGILRGLEKQVILNALSGSASVVRGAAGVLVLSGISSSIVAYLVSQLCVGFLETTVMALAARKYLGQLTASRGRFDIDILRSVWRFSIQVGGVSICAMLLKQLDKIVIAGLLPIEQLGFYATASLIGTGLAKVNEPVQAAVFPRLSRFVSQGDSRQLAQTFHTSMQVVSFIAAPVACFVVFYAYDILRLWTRSEELTMAAGPVLQVLGVAMLLNAMMSIPYTLQLAAGLTWLPLCTNATAVLILTPCLYWLVSKFGIVGGAVAWLIFNALYFTIVPEILFRYVLPGHRRPWLLEDTLPFIMAAVAAIGLGRWCVSQANGVAFKLVILVLSGLCYAVVTFLLSVPVRRAVLSWLSQDGLAFSQGLPVPTNSVVEQKRKRSQLI